jgi:hypothetical protein
MKEHIHLRQLEPREELAYLRELHGRENHPKIVEALTECFNVLQGRAQTLLSVVAIILTISGFSGPSIASSSVAAKACVGTGLTLVLLAAVVTLGGPLQLRWSTRTRAETLDDSMVSLIQRRNARTRKYHAALGLLVAGMTSYVGGLISYVFHL